MESGVYLAIDSDSQNLFLHRFGMKFDFLQIYFFLIRHKEIKKNKNMPHESCVAEVCKNTTLFVKGFDGVLPQR